MTDRLIDVVSPPQLAPWPPFRALPVVDVRTGEPIRMTYDSPRCQHCGKRFAPVNAAIPVTSNGEAKIRDQMGATHCRRCRNAAEAALWRGAWSDA